MGFNRREARVPCARAFTQSHVCCQLTPTVELPHQHDLELGVAEPLCAAPGAWGGSLWHQSPCLDGISHRPATPGGARAHRVYLHGSGVLMVGRHTRRQGDAQG